MIVTGGTPVPLPQPIVCDLWMLMKGADRLQENPIEKHQIAKIACLTVRALTWLRYEKPNQNQTQSSLQFD